MTLLETVLAMAIMMVVMATVGTAVKLLSAQTSVLGQTTRQTDELIVAEQAVVQDIHAAASAGLASSPWCYSSGGIYAPSATPSTQLKFTANLKGAITAYNIQITGGSLTVSTSPSPGLCGGPWGAARALVTGLSGTSEFTDPGCSTLGSCAALPTIGQGPPAVWTGGSGASYDYYPALGVSLTIDGANNISTTQADDTVDVWNVEDDCQASWQVDPQTSPAMQDPC